MTADLLRRAATKIRETAGAATPGPWASAEMHGRDICDEAWSERAVVTLARPDRTLTDYPGDPIAYTYAAGYEGNDERADEDAAHIAAWGPDAALAVADLLGSLANAWRIAGSPPAGAPFACQLARHLLGEDT